MIYSFLLVLFKIYYCYSLDCAIHCYGELYIKKINSRWLDERVSLKYFFVFFSFNKYVFPGENKHLWCCTKGLWGLLDPQ